MDIETGVGIIGGRDRAARRDATAETLHSIVERMADPYLTEHDRWVLDQFARFLGGCAPHPDPRVVCTRAKAPVRLFARIQRTDG